GFRRPGPPVDGVVPLLFALAWYFGSRPAPTSGERHAACDCSSRFDAGQPAAGFEHLQDIRTTALFRFSKSLGGRRARSEPDPDVHEHDVPVVEAGIVPPP